MIDFELYNICIERPKIQRVMSKIDIFLSNLNRTELAYFFKFKLGTYIPETQLKIKKYIKSNGLFEDEVNRLLLDNSKIRRTINNEACNNCGSKNLLKRKVEWTNNINEPFNGDDEVAAIDGFLGIETFKYEITCNVCGCYNLDPNREKPTNNKEKIRGNITGILYEFMKNLV